MTIDRKTLDAFERVSARVLGTGVAASATLLAAGLVSWSAGAGPGQPLLAAGLIALMATPAVRLLVSLVEYVLLRDWFFVAATVTVVLVLLAGLLSALLWG
jgi:uncharacterized membrane protein